MDGLFYLCVISLAQSLSERVFGDARVVEAAGEWLADLAHGGGGVAA